MAPAHYRGISLRNFRGFKKADNIRLAPLTFLVGPNSSGKSSLFDAILFVVQSGFAAARGPLQSVPTWMGHLVDLGSFEDTIFAHRTSLAMYIEVELSSNEIHQFLRDVPLVQANQHPFRVGFKIRSSRTDPAGRVIETRLMDVRTGEEARVRHPGPSDRRVEVVALGRLRRTRLSHNRILARHLRSIVSQQSRTLSGRRAAWDRISKFLERDALTGISRGTERVSSGRSAPERWYPITGSQPVPRYLSEGRVYEEVSPALLDAAQRFEHSLRVRKQTRSTSGSLATHLRTIGIASSINHTKLSAYHSSIKVRDHITGVTSNLIDVGYGASQAIPVIHACLNGASGPLFVEQPEIHLHPKAQGDVADLLCRTSGRRQVVVETHSVHMINRARILVARGELDPSDVVVNYVSRTRTGSRVREIPILPNGEFGTEWPEGFFEERYQDILELLETQAREVKVAWTL